MPKKTIVLLASLLLVLFVACVASTPTPAPAPTVISTTAPPTPTGPITVTILHTNDMHGYLEGEKLTGGNGGTFEFGGIVNAMGTVARLKQEAGANTINRYCSEVLGLIPARSNGHNFVSNGRCVFF